MTNWKENFMSGKELVISSCSSAGEPHSIIAISLGIIDSKLLIGDCEMNTTLKNLQENPKISVISGYFRIKGAVHITDSGKYFDICVKENTGTPYQPKHALLVDIESVYDLDKQINLEI